MLFFKICTPQNGIVLLNSTAAICVIPQACHLVTFRFIYLTKFMLGNCKYVNKMHFIKCRTNQMLSSHINNYRLFNLTKHNTHCPKQLQMFLHCISTGCSGHALWPAAPATVGCLYRWRVTYLGRSTSHRQLFIGQSKRVISRVAGKFKCTAVSLATGDTATCVQLLMSSYWRYEYTGFRRFREIY